MDAWKGASMTVIFQLFCVDDLRRLFREEGARQSLLEIIQRHLPARRLILEATNDTRLEHPNEIPDQIPTEIQKRFDAVSEQLQSSLPTAPADAQQFELQESLLDQLITARRKLAPLSQDEENIILQWAISCEVNHYNFYHPLLKIKEEAYALFKDKTGHPPKGPDSYYALFNPLNPLYELFTELKLKKPPEG
jgi:hypothetical protein